MSREFLKNLEKISFFPQLLPKLLFLQDLRPTHVFAGRLPWLLWLPSLWGCCSLAFCHT
jgi:hypothetical protein